MGEEMERRLHVRVKPSADLPATAVLKGSGVFHESLTVIDVSVGGLCVLAGGDLTEGAPGTRVALEVNLSTQPAALTLTVELRWRHEDLRGVAFVDPSSEQTATVGRYVAELLERGASR